MNKAELLFLLKDDDVRKEIQTIMLQSPHMRSEI